MIRYLLTKSIYSLDVNECVTVKPCKNGATCVNTAGGYQCSCLSGFQGKHCDQGNLRAAPGMKPIVEKKKEKLVALGKKSNSSTNKAPTTRGEGLTIKKR